MPITPPPPPDERERTRRVIVYVLLGVIALVALGPWVCVAIGRLSVAEVKELYVAVAPGWLPALASSALTFFFTTRPRDRR